MKQLFNATRKFLRDEEGVTAIEYALIASLIAIAVITTVTLVGNQLNVVFNTICNKLKGSGSASTVAC